MQQPNFKDPVAFSTARPYPNAVSGRPVVPPRSGPSRPSGSGSRFSGSAAESYPPSAADPDRAGSARPATAPAQRGRLTEEALRERIERVLVEIVPRRSGGGGTDGGGEDSKVSAALRQAIVDSAAFPTLFTD